MIVPFEYNEKYKRFLYGLQYFHSVQSELYISTLLKYNFPHKVNLQSVGQFIIPTDCQRHHCYLQDRLWIRNIIIL